MAFPELSLDQRRHLIDVQQRYEAWRGADRSFRESNKGSMTWKWSHGKQYLYRIIDQRIQKSIGPRTPETEKLKQDYTQSRKRSRDRVTKMRKGIEATAAMNRAMGLMRVPRLAANVLRALDHEGLLGRGLFIVGTHALYAYEAKTGDVAQAVAVAQISQLLGLKFDAKELSALPADLLAGWKTLLRNRS
jgi:hypothetical protein